MENKIVFKDKELKDCDNRLLGIAGENEQEILVFSFEDGFVDGTGYLEVEFPEKCYTKKSTYALEKDLENECYKVEVRKSLLTTRGDLKMQLKIIENTSVWKSLIFEMFVEQAIEDDGDVVIGNGLTPEEKKKLESLENYDDTEIKKSIEANGEGIEQNKTNIAKNTADIEAQGTKIEVLETDNETNKTDINALKEDLTALESDKADKTELPTKVSELENDDNFIDNAVDDLVNYYKKSEAYTKQEVNTIVGNISTLKILVVESLPTQDIDTSTIYFKAKENSDEDNIYDEFIRVSNKWEKIGDTKVDLSNYVTIEMLNGAIANFLTSEQVNTLITNALANYYTKEEMDALLEEKASVDFVNGVKEEMHERLVDIEEKVKISTDTVIAGKHVYGIRRKLTDNSSPEWERIDDNIGLVANAKKETLEYVRNDFDNIYPWRSD